MNFHKAPGSEPRIHHQTQAAEHFTSLCNRAFMHSQVNDVKMSFAKLRHRLRTCQLRLKSVGLIKTEENSGKLFIVEAALKHGSNRKEFLFDCTKNLIKNLKAELFGVHQHAELDISLKLETIERENKKPR